MVIKSLSDIVLREPEYIRKIKEIVFSDVLKENEYTEIMGDLKWGQLEYFLKEEEWAVEIHRFYILSELLNVAKLVVPGRRFYIFYNQTKNNIIIIRKDFFSTTDERDVTKIIDKVLSIHGWIRQKMGISPRDNECTRFTSDWGLFIYCYVDYPYQLSNIKWEEDKVEVEGFELQFFYKVDKEKERGIAFIHETDLLDLIEKLIKKYFKKKEI